MERSAAADESDEKLNQIEVLLLYPALLRGITLPASLMEADEVVCCDSH